jgi:ribonuclease-3
LSLNDLETSLGVTFGDRGLLRQALVHRSYLNEHGGSTLDSYERMEFLGDAVLELIVSTELYQSLPRVLEGELTKARSSLVCRASLARAARRLSLGRHISLGKGEVESGGHDRESILEETFEALVAAIYLDQGYDTARLIVLNALKPDLDDICRLGRAVDNPKSRLQELVQGMGRPTPRYETVSSEGPDHQPVFTVQVLVGDEVVGQGAGNRKTDAERAAAQVALGREAAATPRKSSAGLYSHSGSTTESPANSQNLGSNPEGNLCSLSSKETGKATSKKPTKASNGAGNAGSGASSMFSGHLTWMRRFGKSWRKS